MKGGGCAGSRTGPLLDAVPAELLRAAEPAGPAVAEEGVGEESEVDASFPQPASSAALMSTAADTTPTTTRDARALPTTSTVVGGVTFDP